MYKVAEEFEIWPDPNMDCGVSCPCPIKKSFTYLRTSQNILMTCWLLGERSLPFGLLVSYTYFLFPGSTGNPSGQASETSQGYGPCMQ